MKQRAALALAAAALAVLCGPALAAGATHTVVIEGMAFAPATLKVRRGDTVVWVNRDLFPHTATASDRRFDSKDIAAGASWKHVAATAGRVDYVCTLHPTMKGSLVVE